MDAVVEFDLALTKQTVHSYQTGFEAGKSLGFSTGRHYSQHLHDSAQDIEIRRLQDRVDNYWSVVQDQHGQIQRLKGLLNQREQGLEEHRISYPLHNLPLPVPAFPRFSQQP